MGNLIDPLKKSTTPFLISVNNKVAAIVPAKVAKDRRAVLKKGQTLHILVTFMIRYWS
jgi:hypothetical protein